MRSRAILVTAFTIVLAAPPLLAQSVSTPVQAAPATKQPTAPPKSATAPKAKTPRRPVGVRALAGIGSTSVAATDTFDTVFGEHSARHWMVGGEITNIWRMLFVQASFSRTEWSGERVFVAGSDVVRLGLPVAATVSPIDVSLGLRFSGKPPVPNPGKKPKLRRRPVPYLGGGIGTLSYTETSPFAQGGDDVSVRVTTFHVMGGLDVPLLRLLHLGVDARYRFARNVFEETGVAGVVGDTDLNGPSFGARLVLGR